MFYCLLSGHQPSPSNQNKAVEFSKLQICVDLFLFSAQYTDVATLVNLPKFTAGQLFYYPVCVCIVEDDLGGEGGGCTQ